MAAHISPFKFSLFSLLYVKIFAECEFTLYIRSGLRNFERGGGSPLDIPKGGPPHVGRGFYIISIVTFGGKGGGANHTRSRAGSRSLDRESISGLVQPDQRRLFNENGNYMKIAGSEIRQITKGPTS